MSRPVSRRRNPRQPQRITSGIENLESRLMLAGNGLAATYFNTRDLTGTSIGRTDSTVNFFWKQGAPDSRLNANLYSARWTGQVEAPTAQQYTFSTLSDDGVRLWIDGKLIINKWNNHAPEQDDAAIYLEAGKHDLKLEYYENYGGSTMQLSWSAPSIAKEVIPQARLYSSATSVTPPSGTPVPKPDPDPTPTPQRQTGALRVSSNGRYLVTANGDPFFYLADTAWVLASRLNRADVDYYLETRASQGFNVIQTSALDEDYTYRNYAGQKPLLNNNPATPNNEYFKHLDYIVGKAASLGVYMAIMPTWGSNVADPSHRIFNTSSAYSYGYFLGSRYRNASNIMWINGGDWAVTDNTSRAIWNALAQGLSDGDKGSHLMTFHPRGGQASRSYWSNESWLDFDMIQSGHGRNSASWDMVSAEYWKYPAKPVVDGEPNYENLPVNAVNKGDNSGPRFDAYDVRKKAYWDIFAGAAGTAYGANDVFQFYNGRGGILGANTPWKQALWFAGAQQLKYLKSLVESVPYTSRIPDQGLVVSSTYGGTDHIQATRDAGGSYALVYTASGKGFTVDMTKFNASTVSASWYDPRTGKLTAAGSYASDGRRTFNAPSQGYANDWVLVLNTAGVSAARKS